MERYHRKRIELSADALAVLELLPTQPLGAFIPELAEDAFGTDDPTHGRTRAALEEIRRRFGLWQVRGDHLRPWGWWTGYGLLRSTRAEALVYHAARCRLGPGKPPACPREGRS